MRKEFWFDMDGTIADLYGVDGWLEMLLASKPTPYEVARPLVNMARLARALNKAQRLGAHIGVISWLAKGGTAEYDKAVTEAKLGWLAKHLPSVKWDEIKIVAYGTPKQTLGNGILFDDEKPNRIAWGEGAHEPTEIFEILATAQRGFFCTTELAVANSAADPPGPGAEFTLTKLFVYK